MNNKRSREESTYEEDGPRLPPGNRELIQQLVSRLIPSLQQGSAQNPSLSTQNQSQPPPTLLPALAPVLSASLPSIHQPGVARNTNDQSQQQQQFPYVQTPSQTTSVAGAAAPPVMAGGLQMNGLPQQQHQQQQQVQQLLAQNFYTGNNVVFQPQPQPQPQQQQQQLLQAATQNMNQNPVSFTPAAQELVRILSQDADMARVLSQGLVSLIAGQQQQQQQHQQQQQQQLLNAILGSGVPRPAPTFASAPHPNPMSSSTTGFGLVCPPVGSSASSQPGAEQLLQLTTGGAPTAATATASSGPQAAAAAPPTVAAAAEEEPIPRRTGRNKLLYVPSDDESVNAYQCYARKQIELFEATQEDVDAGAQGRNKPIIVGQVGIRCIHCSDLHPRFRARAAVYYPSRLGVMYQAAQNIVNNHLPELCESIPEETRQRLLHLTSKRSAVGGGKVYWGETAAVQGVIDTERGLRFKENPLP